MNKVISFIIIALLMICDTQAKANTLSYNYSSVTSVPINLSIVNKIST